MKKNISIIIILSIVAILFAQNPFTSKTDKTKVTESKLSKNSLWLKIVDIQKNLNRSVSSSLRKLKQEFDYKIFLILIGVSFLYGVVHAIGPGHGKMLVGAYFLKEKASVFSSLKIGSIISITHSGSAAILGLLVGIFFKSAKMYKDDFQMYITIFSGILIAVLGVFYLLRSIFPKKFEHNHNSKEKNELLLGVFSGMVPCPVSLTIILFSIYLDLLWVGISCVLALSLGMAVTISLIGILVIKTRAVTEFMTRKRSTLSLVMGKILSISGSLIIISIGVFMALSKI